MMLGKAPILQMALSAVSWGSAVLSGLGVQAFAATPDAMPGAQKGTQPVEPLTFERGNDQNRGQLFAAHSSHASHASHYSGSGGAAAQPKDTNNDTNADSNTPASRTAVPKSAVPSKAGEGVAPVVIVLRVQAQLREKGYYNGLIDGQFGATTKDAIKRFQLVKGLPPTGALDDATLAGLGVAY